MRLIVVSLVITLLSVSVISNNCIRFKKVHTKGRAEGRSLNLGQRGAWLLTQSGRMVGKWGRSARQAARTKEHGATSKRTPGPAARLPVGARAPGRNVERITRISKPVQVGEVLGVRVEGLEGVARAWEGRDRKPRSKP